MKVNLKKYIIITIIIVSYIMIVICGYLLTKKSDNKKNNIDNTIEEKKSKYLIFDNYLILNLNEKYIIEDSFDNKKYMNYKFYTFVNGIYFGEYYYRNIDSEVYLFKDNNESVKYKGALIANNYDKNMKIINLNNDKINENDLFYADKVLKENIDQNNYSMDNISLVKYRLDIDNDNEFENLYSLNEEENIDSIDLNTNFSFIYYIKNNKINYLIKNINDGYNTQIVSVLDFNLNGKIDVLYIKSKSKNHCYGINEISNNKINKLYDC